MVINDKEERMRKKRKKRRKDKGRIEKKEMRKNVKRSKETNFLFMICLYNCKLFIELKLQLLNQECNFVNNF